MVTVGVTGHEESHTRGSETHHVTGSWHGDGYASCDTRDLGGGGGVGHAFRRTGELGWCRSGSQDRTKLTRGGHSDVTHEFRMTLGGGGDVTHHGTRHGGVRERDENRRWGVGMVSVTRVP